MHFAAYVTTLLSLAACVWAANITVTVGDGGLTFTPNTVNASAGDIVVFQFFPGNHTATQSTFASPCTRLSSGADSGFQAASAEYAFTVSDTTPFWFYCRQSGHCKSGMVFAVNPTDNETFDAFQDAATGTTYSSSSGSSSGSSGSSPTKSVPTSSSTSSSSPSGAAPGLNPSYLAGIINLVVALAAPFL